MPFQVSVLSLSFVSRSSNFASSRTSYLAPHALYELSSLRISQPCVLHRSSARVVSTQRTASESTPSHHGLSSTINEEQEKLTITSSYLGEWGNLGSATQKGITTYSISPNRQRPLAGTAHAAVFNVFRRTRHQILFWLPPLVLAYAAMDWATEKYDLYDLHEQGTTLTVSIETNTSIRNQGD